MIKMIVFMPHVFGESIDDALDQIKEFETVEEMKERYETPEMEIVEFETEDIITQSTPIVPFEDILNM